MAPLYEIWLFEAKPVPELDLPVSWTLALRTLGTNTTNLYTIAGGIRLVDGPYTHRIMRGIPFNPAFDPISDFDKFTPIGTLDEAGFCKFEEAFERTEAGPNQFFFVRVFGEMAMAGLMSWDVVREWRGKARYAEREWEMFLGEYTIADRRFIEMLEQMEPKN
ncbi:hypothetical protein BJX68DRAFT_267111 [Aspergillus pseudodeflectus]|uniref:Uncharacterized protein n=1 Tax=Aspergillus pseudodeflectus TaxID=176178 RepID=A0ABR4KBY8_9EURO